MCLAIFADSNVDDHLACFVSFLTDDEGDVVRLSRWRRSDGLVSQSSRFFLFRRRRGLEEPLACQDGLDSASEGRDQIRQDGSVPEDFLASHRPVLEFVLDLHGVRTGRDGRHRTRGDRIHLDAEPRSDGGRVEGDEVLSSRSIVPETGRAWMNIRVV